MKNLFKILVVLSLAVVLCGGCTSQKEDGGGATADPHSHSISSIEDAVKELSGYRDDIKAAFDAGTPGNCDAALHESMHVLNALPESEPVQALSADNQEVVKTAVKDFFDCLNAIHNGFHGGEGVAADAYSNVAAKMDSAIEAIAGTAASAP